MNTNQVSITGLSLIVASNHARSVCWVIAASDFYIGNASVTSGNGMLVKANVPFPVESQSAIYGSGSGTVYYFDEDFGAAPHVTA